MKAKRSATANFRPSARGEGLGTRMLRVRAAPGEHLVRSPPQYHAMFGGRHVPKLFSMAKIVGDLNIYEIPEWLL